ncbi:MAG TPA: ring-cleaving dioxygenase [Acidobacteriota bacterium]|nr:ring-cleaving dioxygenase [Acidobacteriota bacterium]
MSQKPIAGLHHVTAIARDAQINLDFYVGVLGLRLVKKTVNFDDPGTYHFYYGDEVGRPGSILTFFPWKTAGRGRAGTGQTSATAFCLPPGQLGFWEERLKSHQVEAERERRMGEDLLSFRDPEGLPLELVASPVAGAFEPWADSRVGSEQAIRGFHSVTLCERDYDLTAKLLVETMGFSQEGSEGNRFRFGAAGESASIVDVVVDPAAPRAMGGRGSVHHIAWRVPDQGEQDSWRRKLAEQGYNVTPILDRNYFHSIYFREAGGVLFELATDGPGFTADESVEDLGHNLKLPSWLEERRPRIEEALPPVRPPGGQA